MQHVASDTDLILEDNICGLDPLLQTYCKLFVHDILSLLEDTKHKGLFYYKGHPILKVDIVGNVVGIRVLHQFTVYSVDDGTGIVSCLQWEHNSSEGSSQLDMLTDRLDTCFVSRIMKMKDELNNTGCQLGDLVHVRGKIKTFFGQVQVNIHKLCQITSPMEEVSHMLQQLDLYKHVYDVAVHLSDKVRLQLQHPETNTLNQERLVKQLKSAISDELSDKQFDTVTCSQLHRSHAVQSVITSVMDLDRRQQMLQQAIEQLVLDGILLKSPLNSQYIVVSRSKTLATAVLDVLRSDQHNSSGYHILYILRQLHRHRQFLGMSSEHINCVLSAMEAESDVISTSDKHYIAFR